MRIEFQFREKVFAKYQQICEGKNYQPRFEKTFIKKIEHKEFLRKINTSLSVATIAIFN